jgi:hypothetical protein
MFLAAVDWYPAIWALEVYVGWRGTLLRRLASLEIHGVLRCSSRLVIGMRTVCMLAHEGRSFANLRYGRVGERVEEVVLGQDEGPLVTLRIDVLIRLKRLVEAAIGRSREGSPRGSQLRLRRSLGGMISLRCNILGDRTEGLRGPQLSARAFEGGQAPRACV